MAKRGRDEANEDPPVRMRRQQASLLDRLNAVSGGLAGSMPFGLNPGESTVVFDDPTAKTARDTLNDTVKLYANGAVQTKNAAGNWTYANEQPFGPVYTATDQAYTSLLEKDPKYAFWTLLAGAIHEDITQLYDDETLKSAALYDDELREWAKLERAQIIQTVKERAANLELVEKQQASLQETQAIVKATYTRTQRAWKASLGALFDRSLKPLDAGSSASPISRLDLFRLLVAERAGLVELHSKVGADEPISLAEVKALVETFTRVYVYIRSSSVDTDTIYINATQAATNLLPSSVQVDLLKVPNQLEHYLYNRDDVDATQTSVGYGEEQSVIAFLRETLTMLYTVVLELRKANAKDANEAALVSGLLTDARNFFGLAKDKKSYLVSFFVGSGVNILNKLQDWPAVLRALFPTKTAKTISNDVDFFTTNVTYVLAKDKSVFLPLPSFEALVQLAVLWVPRMAAYVVLNSETLGLNTKDEVFLELKQHLRRFFAGFLDKVTSGNTPSDPFEFDPISVMASSVGAITTAIVSNTPVSFASISNDDAAAKNIIAPMEVQSRWGVLPESMYLAYSENLAAKYTTGSRLPNLKDGMQPYVDLVQAVGCMQDVLPTALAAYDDDTTMRIKELGDTLTKMREEYYRVSVGQPNTLETTQAHLRQYHLPSANWHMRPEFTGRFRQRATIVATIERALSKMQEYFPALAAATLDDVVTADVTTGFPGAFVAFAASLHEKKGLTFTTQYNKDVQYRLATPNMLAAKNDLQRFTFDARTKKFARRPPPPRRGTGLFG